MYVTCEYVHIAFYFWLLYILNQTLLKVRYVQ